MNYTEQDVLTKLKNRLKKAEQKMAKNGNDQNSPRLYIERDGEKANNAEYSMIEYEGSLHSFKRLDSQTLLVFSKTARGRIEPNIKGGNVLRAYLGAKLPPAKVYLDLSHRPHRPEELVSPPVVITRLENEWLDKPLNKGEYKWAALIARKGYEEMNQTFNFDELKAGDSYSMDDVEAMLVYSQLRKRNGDVPIKADELQKFIEKNNVAKDYAVMFTNDIAQSYKRGAHLRREVNLLHSMPIKAKSNLMDNLYKKEFTGLQLVLYDGWGSEHLPWKEGEVDSPLVRIATAPDYNENIKFITIYALKKKMEYKSRRSNSQL